MAQLPARACIYGVHSTDFTFPSVVQSRKETERHTVHDNCQARVHARLTFLNGSTYGTIYLADGEKL